MIYTITIALAAILVVDIVIPGVPREAWALWRLLCFSAIPVALMLSAAFIKDRKSRRKAAEEYITAICWVWLGICLMVAVAI